MGKIAEECNLDVERAEQARALHRVVRAMHDGHCPRCGCLESADVFMQGSCHKCPDCGFRITHREAELALAEFRPYLVRSVEVFEAWRSNLLVDVPQQEKATILEAARGSMVGKWLEAARARAERAGQLVRVLREDGRSHTVTCESNPRRINVIVESGKITEVVSIG